MADSSTIWLGLDIGGANLKAAHSQGLARSLPFELWKRPGDLSEALANLVATFPHFDRIAVTMTAELCDCFATKAEGVNAVLDAVLYAAQGRQLSVWGVDGRFHDVGGIREQPRLAAASNWLALAICAARLVPLGPGLLIDIGSTTTDLIPLTDGRVVARGRTDTERLQTGELVYAGVRRTPICALATSLTYRNMVTGLSAELFATTLDVFLTLGDIATDPTDRATADGRPATPEAALDRLARMIGADRDDFTSEDARAFARDAHEVLLDRLCSAARRTCEATIEPPRSVIVAGSGEFLARRLAARILPEGGTIVGLAEAWGIVASTAACAHALVELASQDAGLLG
jgi:probable H4MPT-linked C1 transfer pathway protein